MAGAPPAGASKGEHNFVADAHNWEQRIKTENEAAQESLLLLLLLLLLG